MNKTVYLLVSLATISTPLCLIGALQGVYEVIEKGDTDRFRDLCASALYTISKEEKKAFKEAAHRKVEERQLNVKNFIPKDLGRLLLAPLWGVVGVGGLAVGAIAAFLSLEEPLVAIGAVPCLAIGGLHLYLTVDIIRKVVSHHDNKINLDRALAIEAMIRRVKATTGK